MKQDLAQGRPASADQAEDLRRLARRVLPHARVIVVTSGKGGVGKTTTIAKLAGNFALQQRKRVALVSIDTYRIAAPEQLQKVAQIMAIPMKVAGTPQELRDAIHSFRSMDLVLIDTAGRSQKDDGGLDELS